MLFDEGRYLEALQARALGRPLVYRETVGSTMDLARELAESGDADGTVVLAEEQTAGRGRRGRSFHSPPGENLYFTVIVDASQARIERLPIAVPLAVAQAIGAVATGAGIKWPNDIWLGERKCCGMLIDIHQAGERRIALIGIGINVNGDPTRNPELAQIATSIALTTGQHVEREPLLADVLSRLETALVLPFATVLEEYSALSVTLGRDVVVHPAVGEPFEGRAARLTPTGSLVVVRFDGSEAVVEAADVSVRPRN